MPRNQPKTVTVRGDFTRTLPANMAVRQSTIPDDLPAKVARMRFVDEMSWWEICSALEDQGITSPSGKTAWTPSMVRNTLLVHAQRLVKAGVDVDVSTEADEVERSLSILARTLDQRGVPSPSGDAWTASAVAEQLGLPRSSG